MAATVGVSVGEATEAAMDAVFAALPPAPVKARFIWTKHALERWAAGGADPEHTISAPNIAEVYENFVRQLRNGTPWALVDEHDNVIDTGTAGFMRLELT